MEIFTTHLDLDPDSGFGSGVVAAVALHLGSPHKQPCLALLDS